MKIDSPSVYKLHKVCNKSQMNDVQYFFEVTVCSRDSATRGKGQGKNTSLDH